MRKSAYLTGDDFCLDNAGNLGQDPQKLFQLDAQIHGLRGDGYQSAAVGGTDGIDRLDIGVMLSEDSQNAGKQTFLILKHELEGDYSAIHHILEGENGIPVFIKSAAADAGHAGSVIDGGCFSNG